MEGRIDQEGRLWTKHPWETAETERDCANLGCCTCTETGPMLTGKKCNAKCIKFGEYSISGNGIGEIKLCNGDSLVFRHLQVPAPPVAGR